MAGALLALINIPTIMIIASIVGILAGLVGMAAVYRCVSRSKSNMVEKEMDTTTKLDQKTGMISYFTKF